MPATIITSVNFSTNFSLNTTPKKFILTDLDSSVYAANLIPLTGVRGVFKITAPNGTVIYNNTNYLAADIVANVSFINGITIPLPLNGDGTVVSGAYTIVMSTQIIDGTNPTYVLTKTITYTYGYVAPVISITQTADCLSPLFTSVDNTLYTVNGTNPVTTRTHTIDYPFGSAGEGTPVIGSNATITTGTFYNGTQTTQINSVVVYTFPDGLIVTDTLKGSKEILVDCTFVCAIYCCLRSIYNQKENFRNVNQVQFDIFSEKFNEIMSIVELTLLAIDCGKTTEVSGYLTKIKLIAECTDDCSCSGDKPTLVTGLGGGSGVNVIVTTGGFPVVVAANTVGNTTTFTITLDAAFVSKVNASYNAVVVAGNASVTVTPSVAGNTTTYSVVANLPTPQNRSEFRSTIAYTTVPTVAIVNSNFLNSGSNIQNATVESIDFAGDPNWANTNNLFKVSGFQVAPNNNYKVDIETAIMGYRVLFGTLLLATLTPAQIGTAQKLANVEVFNQTSGQFFFRFLNPLNNLPFSNNLMKAFPSIIVNIKISE